MIIKYYEDVYSARTLLDSDGDIVLQAISMPPELDPDLAYSKLLELKLKTYLQVGGTFYLLTDKNVKLDGKEFIVTYNGESE